MLAILVLVIGNLLWQVLQEAMVLVGYTTPREFGIGDPASDIPALFTVESIEAHITGFVTGIVVWILTHLATRRFDLQ